MSWFLKDGSWFSKPLDNENLAAETAWRLANPEQYARGVVNAFDVWKEARHAAMGEAARSVEWLWNRFGYGAYLTGQKHIGQRPLVLDEFKRIADHADVCSIYHPKLRRLDVMPSDDEVAEVARCRAWLKEMAAPEAEGGSVDDQT